MATFTLIIGDANNDAVLFVDAERVDADAVDVHLRKGEKPCVSVRARGLKSSQISALKTLTWVTIIDDEPLQPEPLTQSAWTDKVPTDGVDDSESPGAPAAIDPKTGQHKSYWVLSEAERAKGFLRPVRTAYKHAGKRPKYPIRLLTDEEKARFGEESFVAWEEYPASESPKTGRYWTDEELHSGCDTTTTMSRAIAETYARNPSFYGATFCCHCGKHFPVGKDGEFVWHDGSRVGT